MTNESSVARAIAIIVSILLLLLGGTFVGIFLGLEGTPSTEGTQVGWESGGNGLAVTVLNSCDDSWTPIFDESIQEWDNGSPDSLTLSTEKLSHDPECEERTGFIHVCNGNYGANGWIGLAVVWSKTSTGLIVSAQAFMNDYYLKQASMSKRKYTMCHEIGHTVGLPHTDTNHYNLDLGNCLDYTTRPWNNEHPGQVNFDKLYDMYGSVGDRKRLLGSTVAANQARAPDSTATEKYKITAQCLKTKSCSECIEDLPFDDDGDTRRMLHKNQHGEACEFRFDGYTLQSHKLLVD